VRAHGSRACASVDGETINRERVHPPAGLPLARACARVRTQKAYVLRSTVRTGKAACTPVPFALPAGPRPRKRVRVREEGERGSADPSPPADVSLGVALDLIAIRRWDH
jgi:hypothetical protein